MPFNIFAAKPFSKSKVYGHIVQHQVLVLCINLLIFNAFRQPVDRYRLPTMTIANLSFNAKRHTMVKNISKVKADESKLNWDVNLLNKNEQSNW